MFLMISQTTDQEYSIEYETIVDQCRIALPSGTDSSKIHLEYMNACSAYFKKKLLSSNYPDYPDYFKEPFRHLYSAPHEGDSEGFFDHDGAFMTLEEMLVAHILVSQDTISIVGSALQFSYNFFEELLDLAVTSKLFPVKQFIVESNDYEGSDHWVTIYECHEGKIKSIYCNG